jgi:DNA-3-methyladenine glycosylase I
MERCPWGLGSENYINYHDNEWGVPVHDDQIHFEFILLEGAQAGLSWSTILNKREHYRKVFDAFDPEKIAQYTEEKVQALLQDSGIVRNKLKVRSAVTNAVAFMKIVKEFGSFDTYIWSFVDGKSIINHWHSQEEVPAKTILSDRISKDLKDRGFKFVGSTIIYSFLQAVGLVNDHITSCFRYKELGGK